jgi:hypothetical protein
VVVLCDQLYFAPDNLIFLSYFAMTLKRPKRSLVWGLLFLVVKLMPQVFVAHLRLPVLRTVLREGGYIRFILLFLNDIFHYAPRPKVPHVQTKPN